MSFPIPLDQYKELPFDMYSYILPSYYWLDESFSVCYRFMPSLNSEIIKGRLLTMHAAHSADVSFGDEYLMEYDEGQKKLHITFLNSRWTVDNIKIFYGNITAVIVSMTDAAGTSQCLCAAPSHPFSSVYKKIYDV